MKRIYIGECKQEVSTFNPHLSAYDDFLVLRGDKIGQHYRGGNAEISGAMDVFGESEGVEMVFGYAACMRRCGGTLAESSWRRIAGEFLESIRRIAAVDGVYLSMHGAMASENETDPEGFLIEKIRGIVGDAVPVVVSMDLHGIPTNRMFRHSDAIVALHTYPHVDFYETGKRSATLLLNVVNGRVRPVTARVPIPALVRGDELITETGLFGQSIRMAQAIERDERGLSAGMFIGNPFTDVPELQSYAFVVADGDVDFASREAFRVANSFWADREAMQVTLKTVDEAMQLLKSSREGTVALVDAADATSSGASGDSNVLIRSVLESGFDGRVLAPIVDAPAVEKAFALGVGKRANFLVGGTLDPERFDRIEIEASVRMLSDGRFHSESFTEQWKAGPTAVLESGSMVIVATTKAVHLFDRSLFLAHGQDPKRFDAVVVKSPHCQPHMYAKWCAAMIHVDAPGSTSANLSRLGHNRCPRPIFPLDREVPFEAQATVYVREQAKSEREAYE